MNNLVGQLMIQCSGETLSATGEPMCTICDLLKLLDNVKNIAVEVAIALAIAMVVYGGYVMMVAGIGEGNSKKFENGKTIIKNALLGVVIVLSAYLVVSELFRLIAPGGGFAPWDQITC